jgi:hypothetical protein
MIDRPAEHVCRCGRSFTKGFGLRVHQRTCPKAAEPAAASLRLYRDVEGDLWAVTGDGTLFLAVSPRYVWEGPATRTLDDLHTTYGPLVELDAYESAQHHASLLDLVERLHEERKP